MSGTSHTSPLVEIMTALRERVMGVHDLVLSTGDGLLVAADAATVHPESIAALSAATLSLGQRLAHEANGGTLRDVTTRCAGRHVLIQAVGDRALLTVLGDEGLDLALLHLHMPATVDQLVRILDHDTPSQAS
ncbi:MULTISPECIES: roadblock/LC7 domain-containing protein [Streptomyces]|jgi:predicted regulator of Ras-like GTPase activity (Roadblock/LC7/MglB family)|uniref:roadblock/LC7 domain-containing protein n=1 Tax=Streptomyces TaxID=1883 RepID=UPI000F550A53|nr:roadblock/LC7 domain-containing protein [Streptomyces sp. ADI97-07]RPK70941.1 Roadblock/LC7 domain protein [Streptomyces sp. ADI97-07]